MSESQYGNYRVIRQLGRGGMGTVYEGVHTQLGRRAAIKVLNSDFARNTEIAARFFNEARAASIIEHPGIVEVYEFGHSPDGTAYLIMELVKGDSLTARLRARGGRLGEDGLRIARQIATTLAEAHAKQIVHRDLKPENLMLVADPDHRDGERVKILDFGIAKIANPDSAPGVERSDADVHTRTGVVMGTPTYMAPEQCRGAGKVDAKADVYALGIILYQMLVGRPPFTSAGAGELIGMHLFAPPTPLAQVLPGLPKELEALVMQMLAKDPTQRPTMTAVAAALGGVHITGLLPVYNGAAPAPAETTTISAASGQAGRALSEKPWSSTKLAAFLGVALGVSAVGTSLVLRGGGSGQRGVNPQAATARPASAPPAAALPAQAPPAVLPAAAPPAVPPSVQPPAATDQALPAAAPTPKQPPAASRPLPGDASTKRLSKKPVRPGDGTKRPTPAKPGSTSVRDNGDVKLVD